MPIRIHAREQAADFKRYGERFSAFWTPTILELDSNGIEQHRIEGFLPADELLAQLSLGLAHAAFKRQDWADASRRFSEVAAMADGDASAEALYWAGVSRYKGSGDPKYLAETAQNFSRQFQDTPWAKKASVWANQPV